jgi:hypothetical protein
MGQCSIVPFLHLKGLDATRIHHELEAVLGPDAILDGEAHIAL